MNLSNLLNKQKQTVGPNELLFDDKKRADSGKSSGTSLSKQSKPEEGNLAKLLTNLISSRQQS
jgi:hypothetical protein